MSSPIGSRIATAIVVTAACMSISACGSNQSDEAPNTAVDAAVPQPTKAKPAGWSTKYVKFKSAHMVELAANAPGKDINHFGYMLCGKQNFSIAINDGEYAVSRIFITCNDPITARIRQARVKRAAKR